jgi:MoaA/NifB/PqqE/SkfB family radical SAM enzyme
MSRKDFESAIALAKQYEQTITIGGGEPTLHPHFKEFLFHAVWELSKTSLS